MNAPAPISTAKPPSRPSPPPRTRITLVALEVKIDLVAQYNPSQLQLDEGASWSPSASSRDSVPPLEFSATRPRSLSLELFFDAFEERDPAWRNVQTRYVAPLTRLTRVIDPDGSEDKRRPPLVKVTWGTGLDSFVGVIESVSTKLTMFGEDGTPVRATCSVKLLEAHRASLARTS
ncbi:MAG TPA: hypothetical protein VHE35_10970 [Kofleriaceae bacterium]|nr:hypothetical protein [Kofleriaceae bacterium]